MSNLMKKWAVLAVIMGGTMYQFGSCLGGQYKWLWAILNEDLFG